jgi:hypothetical protein
MKRLPFSPWIVAVFAAFALGYLLGACVVRTPANRPRPDDPWSGAEERKVLGYVPPGTVIPNDPEEAKKLIGR